MCIYFVKHYTCGHYADYLQPTLLSHCREFDLVLRYWHDQVHYQPLEAAYSELGTIKMPQPCRPVWPIPFPANKYLPLPNPHSDFPIGLARPRLEDVHAFKPGREQGETLDQIGCRENRLIDTIGSFQAVASHQDRLNHLSIRDETTMYQQLYPNTAAQSVRLSGDNSSRIQPYYPLSYISTILNFNSRRHSPLPFPNVIIYPHPTGCLRTPHPHCNHDPTNPRGLQCPWLLSIRTPWRYPGLISPTGTGIGVPRPFHRATFLADFSNRGGAVSNHNRKDAAGSELIRVGITRDRVVERIPDIVYSNLQTVVPLGPWRRSARASGIPAQPSVVPAFTRVLPFSPAGFVGQEHHEHQHNEQYHQHQHNHYQYNLRHHHQRFQQHQHHIRTPRSSFTSVKGIRPARRPQRRRHQQQQQKQQQTTLSAINSGTAGAVPSSVQSVSAPHCAPPAPVSIHPPAPIHHPPTLVQGLTTQQQQENPVEGMKDEGPQRGLGGVALMRRHHRQQQQHRSRSVQQDWLSEGDKDEERQPQLKGVRNWVKREAKSDI